VQPLGTQYTNGLIPVPHAWASLQAQHLLTFVTSTPPTPVLLHSSTHFLRSMLPALTYQVAGQLAPEAFAAARSWAGSSLFRRSLAAGEGCRCCWGTLPVCCSRLLLNTALLIREQSRSIKGINISNTCPHMQWCISCTCCLLFCCRPSGLAPCSEAAGPPIQEVKTAQDYDAIMKHLTGTAEDSRSLPHIRSVHVPAAALLQQEQHR
jgi:hypothetical protein